MITIEKSHSIHPAYYEIVRLLYGNNSETETFIHDSKCGMEALTNNQISTVFFMFLMIIN